MRFRFNTAAADLYPTLKKDRGSWRIKIGQGTETVSVLVPFQVIEFKAEFYLPQSEVSKLR